MMFCRSGDFSEVRFSYSELRLRVFTYRDGRLMRFFEVHIASVYVTQSVFLDMVTIRTADVLTIPSGYLCTVASTHWAKIEQEVNLCLINITNATLKIHQQLTAKCKRGGAEVSRVGHKVVIPARQTTHSQLVAVRPLQPPPSVMSPTKASRFKLLIPAAHSQPTYSFSPPLKQPISPAVTVPLPRVNQTETSGGDVNVVRGFSATKEPVSFVLNGRQVGLWQDLLSAQKQLLSLDQLSEKERLFRTKPNIFIDFTNFKINIPPSRTKSDSQESVVSEENMNTHDKLNLLRTMSSRPSTSASRKSSRPSRSSTSKHLSLPSSGEDCELLSEEGEDDGDNQLQFKLVMIVDTQRIMQVNQLYFRVVTFL